LPAFYTSNSDLSHIFYRFWDIAQKTSEISVFVALNYMLERDLAIDGMSICPSVCLSVRHTLVKANEPIGLCGFHRQVAQGFL